MVACNYGPKNNPLNDLNAFDRGNISVYARNRDYHDVLKKKLKTLGRWLGEYFQCELKVFVDTAPISKSHSPRTPELDGKANIRI